MLFPSTLVISDDITTVNPILSKLGHETIINNPDIFLITEYNIENVRQITKFLSQHSYSHQNKIVLIPDANLLNLESQNTLLKNLEEPGDNNYFILVTSKPNSLLSTIISRCQTLRLQHSTTIPTKFSYPKTIKDSLLMSESLSKDKTTVLPFLENLIATSNPLNFEITKKLIKASQMIQSNVDTKNALDYLFLSLLV